MSEQASCSHCLLPLGRLGEVREVHGEKRAFCCYGCCLAYQVHHGDDEEPAAAAWLIRIGIGAFLSMNIMLFSLLLYSGSLGAGDDVTAAIVHWLLLLLATPLMLVLGGPFIAGAFRAARQRRIGTDALVAIGTLAAYGYSAWQVWHGSGELYFDTVAMVLILFTVGRYLEAIGRVRAVRSLGPMLAAERAYVRVMVDDCEIRQPIGNIQPGAIVRILAGEQVAVDAMVIEGLSECDETILTGQAQPQVKMPGSRVYAGSINGTGNLLVRATEAGTATRWIRISKLVREALSRKSPLGDALDRAAAAFIPIVLMLAAGTVWFWTEREPFEQALMTGLAVLVVACPCSLGLAASLAATLGIGLAAQRGILLRGGGMLEKLAQVEAVAFDKTGTLTHGRPHVLNVVDYDSTGQTVLRRATALAQASAHPLAKAIADAGRDISPAAGVATAVRAIPGKGVSGKIDGEFLAMGSASFMASLGWNVPSIKSQDPRDAESTLVYVGWGEAVHGHIELSDELLPEARELVAALHARGLPVLLLSGDREPVVATTATRLGIVQWRSELSPEAKVLALQDWRSRHGATAMVGDGMNDGPVLAAASVGIAVGGAADLARESADAVLPEGALGSLPWLLDLAAQVRRSIRANIAWAFAYNGVALALAVSGLLQPAIAAGLMAGSSLVVVTRSLHAGHGRRATTTGDAVVAHAA